MERTSFINKTQMKKVNAILKKNGYSSYPGDETSNGRSGSGYVSNLLNYLSPMDAGERNKIFLLIEEA